MKVLTLSLILSVAANLFFISEHLNPVGSTEVLHDLVAGSVPDHHLNFKVSEFEGREVDDHLSGATAYLGSHEGSSAPERTVHRCTTVVNSDALAEDQYRQQASTNFPLFDADFDAKLIEAENIVASALLDGDWTPEHQRQIDELNIRLPQEEKNRLLELYFEQVVEPAAREDRQVDAPRF